MPIARKLIFKIAYRYFRSKKSHSVINLISTVSVFSIAVPTAAMIILLSVHNGFEGFVHTLWHGVSTELVVEPAEGNYFDSSTLPLRDIRSLEGVSYVGGVIEENVIARYKDKQIGVSLRGVEEGYEHATSLHSVVTQGAHAITDGALVGAGVAYALGLKMNLSSGVSLLAARDGGFKLSGENAYYHEQTLPLNGVFRLDVERDASLVFISLAEAESLLGREGKITALAVGLSAEANGAVVEREVQKLVGESFDVKNIFEQNELEYKLVHSEKWAIYMIIMLVLIIASLTLIGTMLMLIIEKKASNLSLGILGFTTEDVRKVFVSLGLLLSSIGATLGVLFGVGVVVAQQLFSFVPLKGASLLMDSYPVSLLASDCILVFVSVMVVTFLFCYISCRLVIVDKK